MKKLFLCFFGVVFCTANLFAADGVAISRSFNAKNVSNLMENNNIPEEKSQDNSRTVSRRSNIEKESNNSRVATRNVKRTNVVARKTNTENTTKSTSRSVNNQRAVNARATLSDGVNTVGRNARVDAASINNTAAVRRAGVVLRASTAEVGGRATIGNTGVQTGSNIDEQVHSNRSRASLFGSKKEVTPTAESIANAKDILEKTADLNNTCQQQYNECMDQFCMVVDANQKRCSCSANLDRYAKVQKAVEEANAELNEVAQNIRYVGLSANEIRAIFSATEAEEAMAKTKDNTQTRSLLDDIAEMIEDPSATSSVSTNNSGFSTMDMDLDFSSDSADMFSLDMFSGSKDISNKRGRDLYTEATKRCKAVLNSCKEAGGTEKLITGNYDLAIDKDCIAYEQGLKKLNDSLLANVRSANLMLQKARLAVLQNKNQYDIKGCVAALEECMLDDMVCGEGYKKCLDPTKQFIDENGNVVLGRNISNITAFMQNYDNSKITPEFIKNVSKTTSCVKGDGDCVVNYLLKKIGTGATVQEGGLCRAVLDKCQDYTYTKMNKKSVYNPYNDVVVNYIQRAMVNIKAADNKIIADYAASCMNDVAECYNEQYSQISSWTTTANADSVYNIMKGSCYNVALTCGHAVFAYDKAMGEKMDEIAENNKENEKAKIQAQNDTLIAGIAELFAQNMICPDNSTFTNEVGEVSPNGTIGIENIEYYIANITKASTGCLVSGVCTASPLRPRLCTACVISPATASYTEDKKDTYSKKAYVNTHCICNTDYVVWNGSCISQCNEGYYRNSSGGCTKCDGTLAGGKKLVTAIDGIDASETKRVTEYTKCEQDTTSSSTSSANTASTNTTSTNSSSTNTTTASAIGTAAFQDIFDRTSPIVLPKSDYLLRN
ncbi:MAG: hypothetical protein IKN73_00770 [Alphaproteobacteria bacterium]|nr:hypothetical protein [Alphaproteobacteria bacterium]